MESSATRRAPLGAVIAILGGVLLVVGSFLSWAEVTGGGVSVTAKGTDGSDGWLTLAAGVVAILVGLVGLRMGRRMLGVIAIVAGLLGGGFGLYDALTAEDSVLDAAAEEIAPQFGVSTDEVRAILDDAIDAGQLDISIAIGLIIVIAGGAIAVIGGVLMLSRGSVPAAATSSEPMPAAATSSEPMPAAAMPPPSAPAEPAAPTVGPPDPAPPVSAPRESGSAPPAPPAPPPAP
jgi:hypothetical protein